MDLLHLCIGRQGWIFDDTFRDGSEPVRMTLGTTDCIQGLEIGLAGDEGPMPAMKYVALKFVKSQIRLIGSLHFL